jgi:hypothetical protein
MTADETSPPDGNPSDPGAQSSVADGDHQPQDDAAREKFRAALARKGSRGVGKGAAAGEQARAHGPSTASAATQRMFRRKSGG